MLVRMEISGLTVDKGSNTPIVVLKEVDGERLLPIWIGLLEAQGIALELEGRKAPRPMTHDLLKNIATRLGASVSRVEISDLRDNTFFARLILEADGQEIDLDARPSDAIAIALRSNAPILCAEEVIQVARATSAESAESPTAENPEGAERETRLEENPTGPRPLAQTEKECQLEDLDPEDFGKYEM